MSSFQKENPPARINLFLELAKGDAQEKVELPMRLLVTGDFQGGRESDVPLEDREKININQDNFETVLKSFDLGAEYNVRSTLSDGNEEIPINLKFDSMAAFHPERVAKQIPELNRLLATRNLLQDLRNRIVSMSEFRKRLESIVTDTETREQLLAELEKLVPSEAKSGTPEEG